MLNDEPSGNSDVERIYAAIGGFERSYEEEGSL